MYWQVLGRSERSGDLAILAIFRTNFYVGIEQNYGIIAKIAKTPCLAGTVGCGYLSHPNTDLLHFFHAVGYLEAKRGRKREERRKKSGKEEGEKKMEREERLYLYIIVC